MFKKIALSILGLIVVAFAGGVYYIQTEYAGIGLPWVTEVALPDFPTDYPSPKKQLSENDSGDIYFATKSPYDFTEFLNNYESAVPTIGKGRLFLPENASAESPVPAIIILHGSGGIASGREYRYADFYNQQGIAAFVLDYYSPRGVTLDMPYLYKVLSATEVDIIVDALSALKVLGTHPSIDATRIGVTGYSYGGMATRYLQDPRFKAIVAPNTPDFAAHIDTYGPCHQTMGNNATTGAPYLSLRGDQDNSVDLAVCNTVEAVMKAEGTPVESHVLAGAGHAWENDAPRHLGDYPFVSGCSFSFDEKGVSLVDGKPVTAAAKGASRRERALARAMLMNDAKHCIGEGYIVGKDDISDKKAKAIIRDFVSRVLISNSQSINTN